MTPKEKAIDLVRDMEFEIPYVHDPTEPQGDDDVTIVKCEYSRNQPFKEIKFNVDDNDWLPKEIIEFL
jgi:hypothetical protein